MTLSNCELFAQDPEGHASHPDSCASCRQLVESLVMLDEALLAERLAPASLAALRSRDLPVAPWEGASQRSWPLVVLAVFSTLFGSMLLFVAGGVSPSEGFRAVLGSQIPTLDFVRIAGLLGESLQNAPFRFQLLLVFAFVLVNVLFALLLRRAPRGVDVSGR